jgi:ankyrin repeat protein
MVKMLLAYGAKPDIQELKSGKTGLLLAIEQGNQDIAELLLCYGGSVGIPSFGGVMPASLCLENRKLTEMINQNKHIN